MNSRTTGLSRFLWFSYCAASSSAWQSNGLLHYLFFAVARNGIAAKAKTMVEILRFDEALRHRARSRPSKPEADDSFSFWPEVSSALWVSGSQPPVDPANSQGKVLSEILLILGAVAVVATVISLLAGMPLAV
jgi:hypothetical protein